jgi:hypothetical protein
MAEDGLFPTILEVLGTAGGFPAFPSRGALRAVILAKTGQDVDQCCSCAGCESVTAPGMALTLGEIVRAARRDDPQALTCATLWACEDLLLRTIPCSAGLALNSIMIALQREAELRGLAPSAEAPPP